MKSKIRQSIENYLKQRQISYTHYIAEGQQSICMALTGYKNAPSFLLESAVFFYSNGLEWRVYYDKTGAKVCAKSNFHSELFKLLNYINATVWIRGTGIPYIYAPRMYMTQDGNCDITMTALIPYLFYNAAPIETCDFFTSAIPQVLDDLTMPIFKLLFGQITTQDACALVDKIEF